MAENGGDRSGTGGTAATARFSTGQREADLILGGGFPLNSINLIMGQPGTGKTIFAEQIVFHNAEAARPIVYYTTLSEPLTKVVRYLQGFRFFDEAKIGSAVIYEDIGPDLVADGPGVLVPRLKALMKTVSPKAIVIDSFRAVRDLMTDLGESRRLMYDLGGLLTAYDTTAFLIGEYDEEDIRRMPEFAVADGIVEFSRRRAGGRDERYFRVLKLRGSSYREGAHAIAITEAGVRFFPRLVSPASHDYRAVEERIATGVDGLDAMVGGGLWRGSSTLLSGPSGSGKTSLALHFVAEGVRRGEPGLYANFQENPVQLARTMRGLGFDPHALRDAGLQLFYSSPVELQMDSILVELFRRIEADGIRRVVIDAVGDLAVSANDPQRLHDYLYALNQHLTVRGVSSMLTMETSPDSVRLANQGPIRSITDNIIALQLRGEERTRRTLQVLKTRRSTLDPANRELGIDGEGVRIL
jgi:circadian clock protein KaiC